MNKLISIIMPVKNGANYLKEAIDAIKKQNMNIEIIVVDDGSTDNTSEIALSLGCNVIRNKESKGQVVAKNTALKVAKGEYIIFHDHDDIMNDNALNIMYNELRNDDKISAVMCKVKDFISPDVKNKSKTQIKEESYYGLFTGAVLMRKSIFDTIGMFSQNIYAGEIIEWQSKMNASNLLIKKLDLVSTKRRVHDTNFGRTNQKQEFNDYASILRAKLANK